MSGTKTVLIADDDRDLVAGLAIRCRKLGIRVLTAHDAMTALAHATSGSPDLVCLDVNMPAGNGLSVCEMMATHHQLQDVPVIIMTGNRDESTQRRCHQLAAYYVPKCERTWERLQPLITELLLAAPAAGPVRLEAAS